MNITKHINQEEPVGNYDNDASKLYRSSQTGILSTISKLHEGYPFGSFVTYVPGRSRTVYLYLSDIAQHTKNLNAHSKSCLTISKGGGKGDKQNSERLTLMGHLKLVPKEDVDDCRNRFYTIFPESERYASFHGFNFYQFEIDYTRWIGGFGKIGWLDADNWKHNIPNWVGDEDSIISHMNNDHANTISSALHSQHGIKDSKAKMLLLTIDGYYIQSKTSLFFIQFPRICNTSSEYKEMLIELSKSANSVDNSLT